ncbi:MAG: DnaJ domain-containing protein, partial [Syntrophobacteria bacterium]
VYTALNLQTHFSHFVTRHCPEALDPDKVDYYFLEELCRLNADETFFKGVEDNDPGSLHPYLVKYAILYFDSDFDAGFAWNEYVQDFMGRRRFAQAPAHSGGKTTKEACRCLGIQPTDFKKMDRNDLTRRYRKLAKEAHPDRGGDQQRFVEIKEAYECLLKQKASSA